MDKLTTTQLFEKIYEHNEKNNIKQQFEDEHPLYCVIVFGQENWPDRNFSEASRSYKFRSDSKYFLPDMNGNSIFASNLDGTDPAVRLDWYLKKWTHVDYCYIEEA